MDRKLLTTLRKEKNNIYTLLIFIILIIILIINLVYFNYPKNTEEISDIKKDKLQKEIIVDRMVVDGHNYKIFTITYQGKVSMSVTHDPNCKTCLSIFD